MSNEPTLNNSQTDWQRLDAMIDEDIDLTDCPEVTSEMFARGVVRRGLPAAKTKTQVTLRIDSESMPINASREAIQKLKYHAKNSGIFANLEAIGSYDDFSQMVVLDYLDEKSFLQLLASFQSNTKGDQNSQRYALQANYESMARFYSTCVHEFTHWLDHTSTLWGQRQLVLIYNAINAWTNQNGYTTPVVPTTMPTSPQAVKQWIDQIIEIEGSIEKFIRACRL